MYKLNLLKNLVLVETKMMTIVIIFVSTKSRHIEEPFFDPYAYGILQSILWSHRKPVLRLFHYFHQVNDPPLFGLDAMDRKSMVIH